jgi:hypothetical protein
MAYSKGIFAKQADDAGLRLAEACRFPDFDITFCVLYRRDPFPWATQYLCALHIST